MDTDFPKTMNHVKNILSLPIYPRMTTQQQDRVIELIIEYCK